MGLFDGMFGNGGAQMAPNGTGILGGMPYANGGGPGASFNQGQPAGGGFMNSLTQWFQNNPQAISGLAAGLMTPTFPGQRGMAFAQGLQGYQQGKQADLKTNETKALGAYAKSDTSLTPQMQALLQSSPDLAKAYLSQTLLNPNQQKLSNLDLQKSQFEVSMLGKKIPQFLKIGTSADGTDQYGFVDPISQTVKPLQDYSTANGSMFNGQSPEGRALNYLIQTGQLDKTQAATFAASKPSQNPATGAVSMITPMAIPGQAPQLPQVPGTPQAGGPQTQAKPPGVIDVTSGKPGGNLTETQQRAKAMTAVVAPEIPIIKENFAALSDTKNQIAGAFGSAGNFVSSEPYQRASNALASLIGSYLYTVSGAQQSPAEIDKQVQMLMPKFGEKPGAIADKLRRIQTYADALNGWAGGAGSVGGAPGQPQGAIPPLQPGQTFQHPSGVTIQRLN